MSMYRKQALEASTPRPKDVIVISQPIAAPITIGISVALLLAALSVAIYGEYGAKLQLNGVLATDATAIQVVASGTGVIVLKGLTEGQSVSRDQLVAHIQPLKQLAIQEKVESRIATVKQKMQLADHLLQIEQAIAADKQNKLKIETAANAELIERLLEQRKAVAGRLAASESLLQKTEELRKQGYVSETQYIDRLQSFYEQKERLEAVNVQISQAKIRLEEATLASKIETLEKQHRTIRAQRETVERTREIEDLDGEKQLDVRTPRAGTVVSMTVKDGQHVSEGRVLFTIHPREGKLLIYAFLPTDASGRVKEGQEAILQFPSLPYAKYGHQTGKVVRISELALTTNEAAFDTGRVLGGSEKLHYRVTIEVDRPERFQTMGLDLRSGMSVTVDLISDRRRILDWIFDPILRLSRRVFSP
jgi:membrane fusion protein